jgi:hypothetical protein
MNKAINYKRIQEACEGLECVTNVLKVSAAQRALQLDKKMRIIAAKEAYKGFSSFSKSIKKYEPNSFVQLEV